MKRSIISILVIILLFCHSNSVCQDYNIKQISGLTGLSQSSINGICVDKVGNIWLGTDFGLNRYDGRDIERYYSDINDVSSLSSDYIVNIYEDALENLWVCTSRGLCLYDRVKNTFVRNPFQLEKDIRVETIFENETHVVFPDSRLNIHFYDKRDDTVFTIELKTSIEFQSSRIRILNCVEYDENSFLILIDEEGVFKLDVQTGALHKFINLDSKHYSTLQKIGMFYYLTTYDDVMKISKEGVVLERISLANSIFKSQIYLDLKENKYDNTIWVTSDYGGIFIVDHNLKILNRLVAGQRANDILPENSVKKIHFINEKTAVIGTVRCGALILYNSGINYYRYNRMLTTGPSDKSILCFEEENKNKLWIGTDGGGLNLLNRKLNSFEYYSSEDVLIVTSILDYSERDLLVASYQKGLYFFNKTTKQFRSADENHLFRNIRKDVRHKIFKDTKGNIWISDGSLVKINIAKNTFERFGHESFFDGIFPIYYTAYESSADLIWFTSVGGMFAYSLKENRFVDKVMLTEDREVNGIEIYSVVEDKFGNLIFGTDKALLYYNTDSKSISEYVEGSSKMNKLYSSLYMDLRNQLWVGTNDELLKVDKSGLITELASFRTLSEDGSIEYRHGAVLRSLDERLYMGSNNGITFFIPENIEADSIANRPVITSLSLLNTKDRSILDTSIVIDVKEDASIIMNYTSGIYKFEFNNFNYPFEEYTEYAYTLQNFENLWHTGTANSATYTNLPPGEYVFKVKSTNKTGQWNTEVARINIQILPPWYQTTWFFIVLVIIIGFIVVLIWRESLVRLKLKHKLDLETSKQEQLEAINQQKLSFFTNISHEIKTPLTLIYSPLKHLITKEASDEEVRKALPSLYRNVRRMIDLIEQLLEFRKTETSTLKLNLSRFDCIFVCKEIINYFDYYTKLQGVSVELSADQTELWIELDKDKFIKILTNLISNAIKFSQSGDIVTVNIQSSTNLLSLEISDCGIGISDEEVNRIFDRYYQVETGIKGTGIGLSLSKHLTELHGGSIGVSSELGKGTSFKLQFPIKQENSSATELAVEANNIVPSDEKVVDAVQLNRIELNNKEKVLIVEDEHELREYLSNALSESYHVLEASDGKDGFTLAHKELPDLIISDVMMPEVNGFELCRQLKNDIRTSHIPVILLTAKSMFEDKAEGYQSGADAYVSKPFDLSLLKLQLASLIRNRQLLQKRFESDPELLPQELTSTDLDNQFLEQAIAIVERHIDNADFKVSHFVEEMGMSRTLVYNKISAIAGKPVKDFILNIRLQKAAKIIVSSPINVSEIAYECGFSDPSYFSTVFKRYYKMSPLQYRKHYEDRCYNS
ncbi:hybrid sensor histidine kinase/response regulator transcription factor [Carboxylicivirga sp. N1Y90]|uniref:hybrid sensor histidine kinase/response regulator transcription factor n=1 Tax=Carboxylicivirga fragile TaxID=3417571 RepID=UPI003D34B714|nr:response regulator [Marinilabiliaceae bacterium N1Y90]